MRSESEERISRFGEQVTSIGGQVVLLPDIIAARKYVTNLAITSNSGLVAVNRKLSPQLFPPETTRGQFEVANEHCMSREQFFAALRIAEIGVSSADLAVAETGTLIMTTSDDMERLVTALPRTHVAVLPHSRLVNSIADAATYVTGILTENNTRGTISLISGTSSTADIGGLVVSGVHGPKNLYVCLLDRELLGST